MDGTRRVRATPVLPRCGPPCLFKGHLSTKSNAFCTDSSSLRLTTLQLIKNHMAVHYNKILSAKAAVDCSIPVSLCASIKYTDQQRREKLKKELARCEREFKLSKSSIQANSKNNFKSFFNTLQKPSGEPQNQDALIEEANGFTSFAGALLPSSETQLSLPKCNKVLTHGTAKNCGSSPFHMDCATSDPRNSGPGMYGRKPRSTFPNSHRFQLAPSGDLLEKHSDFFSNKQLPFTPRTLKTEAKSFLSQYRYYTPAKRRKDFTDPQIEPETQTELSSFNSDLGTSEIKKLTDSEVNTKQVSNYMTYGTKEKITPLPLQGDGLTWDAIKDGTLQHPSQRTVCQYSVKLPSENKIYSNEEELLYLSFIQDVTNEILKLGLFSSRFLERLFERHIKQNTHRLKEEKMRHLLHGLKIDLGCTSEENSVKPQDVKMLNSFEFEKAMNSEQNGLRNAQDIAIQQEHQQYQNALDMLLSAPKDENEMPSQGEFFMPVYKSKYSAGVIIQQVNDEPNLEPSTWDENNPRILDSLRDHETSMNIIEGDSDTEKGEASNELSCYSTSLSQSVQLYDDNNHDKELPSLKIMETSIEDDCPLDI
ncbi:spermatogenesis-associated protein 7 isoform X1 [Heterocephalus glaber]|uniref:Spermatogenesis-associated protein 7 isoform X1 n=1 Tax=Heterocephalus glaber TaxID=10181 RepID=A0AAX6NUB8_HETGA|nr:spermatogenesis-associated protein 7 isoform X1 [Heterocephalus glaber]